MYLQPAPRRLSRVLKITSAIMGLPLLAVVAGLLALNAWPQLAAQNIDHLRNIIGDAPVAQLETVVLGIQDHAQQVEFSTGLVKPAAPWDDTVEVAPLTVSQPNLGVVPAPTLTTGGGGPQALIPKPSISVPPAVANQPAWQPRAIAPLGTLSGEGQWQAYLFGSPNQALAYRTFLQPDPLRPYSVAAVVAFNLQTTRLHFVLGTQEPMAITPPTNPATVRTGEIPAADLQPGLLLAAFNGGFKGRHGEYGAMANGLTALPPLDGVGTVAIYKDGHVAIGDWGKDIKDSPDLVAWRQNGELLIHNEQINPDTALTTKDWGLTVQGAAVTWRSAVGISADGHTLYYVAGPQLDVATLTKVMAQLGAAQALQLDINNFWVNFAAIRSSGSALTTEPLLKGMTQLNERFLKSNSRDFFYLTAAAQ